MSEAFIPKDRPEVDAVILANVERAARMELKMVNPQYTAEDFRQLVQTKLGELNSSEKLDSVKLDEPAEL